MDRYGYIQLPFGVAPAGDMFQKKQDEFFHGILNLFGIADDILIAWFGKLGRDYDATLDEVLRILKLSRCTSIPF